MKIWWLLVSAFLFAATPTVAQSLKTEVQLGQTDSGQANPSKPAKIQQTDPVFEDWQSLVERYNCSLEYPDRDLTRAEFAAGLNACLDRVKAAISSAPTDAATQADLETIQKLQAEFATELTALRQRVDSVETRANIVEKQQFSTTTKLSGQIIFAFTDAFGGASSNGQSDNYNATLSDRVRINFNTSFTGKDLLTTRIQASNIIDPRPATNTSPSNETRLSFQSGGDTTNAGFLSLLKYDFPVNDSVKLTAATGFNIGFIDVLDNIVNPLASDSQASLSRFGRYNPIYRLGFDTGGAANIKLSPDWKLEVGYLASQANNPSQGTGLFGGNYAALGQVVFTPKFGTIALTYVNAYSDNGLNGGTGSVLSNLSGRAISSNSYGVEANFKLTPGLQAGGWVGYTNARAVTGTVRGDGDIWTYAMTLAFPDLGQKGNLGGLIVGMQPKLTGTSALLSGLNARSDRDTGLHIEGFYRYALTKDISITPGIIWLTAPNHNRDNGDAVVGVIRTTFIF
jgi:Carbohydrate-selective porin, OprB family